MPVLPIVKQQEAEPQRQSPGLEELAGFLQGFGRRGQVPGSAREPEPLVPPGGTPGRIPQQFFAPWSVPPGQGLFSFLAQSRGRR